MSVSHGYYFSLTGKGEAELVDGQYMTSGFFETLEVKPLLGRTFTEQEEIPGAAAIALISEGLWKRKFDASPHVLSRTISLNGRSYSIVGVIPSSFHLTVWGMGNRDVYLPMGQWNAPGLWPECRHGASCDRPTETRCKHRTSQRRYGPGLEEPRQGVPRCRYRHRSESGSSRRSRS